jgi:cell division protein FtsQ
MVKKGDPRRIFVGNFSGSGARVIHTAKNAPDRRQKVRPRKRVLVARRKKVAGAAGSVTRLALFVAAATFVAVSAYRYTRSSPRFLVSHIAVDGNVHITAREVIARSGIIEGQSVFEVDLDESAAAIGEIPWVREARVLRRLPGRVHIEIIEREPVALLPSKELLLMDETGKIVADAYSSGVVDAPLITGGALGPLKPGDVARAEGLDEAIEIVRLMGALGVAAHIGVSEINIADPTNITLVTKRSGANIYLGTGDMEGKLWRLTRVVRAINAKGSRKTARLEKVDLRFGSIVPTRIGDG